MGTPYSPKPKTEALPSDCLVSYSGHSLVGGGVLPLSRDKVSVFNDPSLVDRPRRRRYSIWIQDSHPPSLMAASKREASVSISRGGTKDGRMLSQSANVNFPNLSTMSRMWHKVILNYFLEGSTAGLNSEFYFYLTGCLTKAVFSVCVVSHWNIDRGELW